MNRDLNKKIIFILLIIYLSLLILDKINIIAIIKNIFCILKPLFWAFIITFLLSPVKKYLIKKGMNKKFSVIFIFIIIIFFMYLVIFNLSPIFINKISNFFKNIPDLLNQLFDILNINDLEIKNKIIKYLTDTLNKLNIKLSSTCISIFSSISSFFIGLIISFYMLFDEFNLKKYFKENTYNLILEITNILNNYVKAIIMSSIVVFILSTLVFIIFGIPNSFIYGLFCGITNVIPYIGPYIGGIIPSIIAFGISTETGIMTIIGIVLVQLIEGNVIHPIIISKSINIHPIVSIMGFIIFANLFGFIGAVISLPSIAIIKCIYLYYKKLYN